MSRSIVFYQAGRVRDRILSAKTQYLRKSCSCVHCSFSSEKQTRGNPTRQNTVLEKTRFSHPWVFISQDSVPDRSHSIKTKVRGRRVGAEVANHMCFSNQDRGWRSQIDPKSSRRRLRRPKCPARAPERVQDPWTQNQGTILGSKMGSQIDKN